MIENVIVILIVAASAWYAAAKYLPARWLGRKAAAKAAGCGGGCDSCNACADPVPLSAPGGQRVIKLHLK